MASVPAQQAVADYHREMSQGGHHGGHHGGHDMYLFHRDWHQQNPDPTPPPRRERDWGVDLAFGINFLQMHHEMVKAADNEPKEHMQHASLASWYASQGYDLPPDWDPLTEIPEILAYNPDPSVYPEEIREAVRQVAESQGITSEQFLQRRTNQPNFLLPAHFTRDGVGAADPGEPYTGARKLADFQNINQLGCCLVFPHNRWHVAIGGAMGSTWTAIADPIFYLGVHWHIDRIFDEYKLILAEREVSPQDRVAPPDSRAMVSAGLPQVEEFSEAELAQRATDIATSERLLRPLR